MNCIESRGWSFRTCSKLKKPLLLKLLCMIVHQRWFKTFIIIAFNFRRGFINNQYISCLSSLWAFRTVQQGLTRVCVKWDTLNLVVEGFKLGKMSVHIALNSKRIFINLVRYLTYSTNTFTLSCQLLFLNLTMCSTTLCQNIFSFISSEDLKWMKVVVGYLISCHWPLKFIIFFACYFLNRYHHRQSSVNVLYVIWQVTTIFWWIACFRNQYFDMLAFLWCREHML